jgi:hypothetical protein
MGYYKELDIRIRNGGDDALAAALELVPRWIPVSERLPKDFDTVLLYLDYRDGHGGQAVGYFLGGEFWLYEDGNIPCSKAEVDVLYWMRLPEAPEDAPLPP